MATKISITKKLEDQLRDLANEPGDGFMEIEVIKRIVKLLDAAHSSKASGSGLPVAKLIAAIEAHRPVVKPPPGKVAEQVYARLQRTLNHLEVTQEQAEALGVWLAAQAWIKDLTMHRLSRDLGEWVTLAVASKPKWERPEW